MVLTSSGLLTAQSLIVSIASLALPVISAPVCTVPADHARYLSSGRLVYRLLGVPQNGEPV
jgi:hypothetical protein